MAAILPSVRARGERTLVYVMQSSGATLVALLLAQRRDAIGVLDVFCGELVPPAGDFPADRPAIVKATISSGRSFEEQRERFEPDHSVLVLRHPCHVYASLQRKRYATMGGTLDGKLRRFESAFLDRAVFDAVVGYEDLVFRSQQALDDLAAIDPTLTTHSLGFARTPVEITAAARRVPALAAGFRSRWDKGNPDGRGLDHHRAFKRVTPRIRQHVESLCPAATAYFDDRYDERFPAWRVAIGGWWGDAIYPRVRTTASTSRKVARRAVHAGRR